MNPLNDPTSEVMFAILIPPLEKDTDNWRMLRGGCKCEQRCEIISIQVTRLSRITEQRYKL